MGFPKCIFSYLANWRLNCLENIPPSRNFNHHFVLLLQFSVISDNL
jgi:hypothetical protein